MRSVKELYSKKGENIFKVSVFKSVLKKFNKKRVY